MGPLWNLIWALRRPRTRADRIRALGDVALNCYLGLVRDGLNDCPYEFGGEQALEWLRQPLKGGWSMNRLQCLVRALRCPSLRYCLRAGRVDCKHCGCYLRRV